MSAAAESLAPSSDVVTELVEYEPGLHQGMLDLFARHFGMWSARGYDRRFRWEREENPFSKERSWRTLLLVANGAVVGHVSGTPVPLRVRGQRQTALAWGSFCVDEPHRGRTLTMLRTVTRGAPIVASGMNPRVQELFDRLAGPKLPATETLWTLRRRRSGILAKQARSRVPPPLFPLVPPWALRAIVPLLHGELGAEPLPSVAMPSGFSVRPLQRFEERYDALWALARERYEASLDKTSLYMNWRYFDCPTLTPHVYGLFNANGALEGVIVGVLRGVRDYRGGLCGLEVTIADLITALPDAEHATVLIGALMNELDPLGVDSFDGFGFDGPSSAALAALGFIPKEDHCFALGVGLGRALRPQIRDLGWYATPGDGDALFAPAL